MSEHDLEQLKYPVGRYQKPEKFGYDERAEAVTSLEALPDKLVALVSNLTDEQLDTPYRPGGWTVRQVVHHIADSHHHSYTRFKWTLTEDQPLIKAYEEKDWAALEDARVMPIQPSLTYLKALHVKLVILIRSMTEAQFQRTYVHPEGNAVVDLNEQVSKYAWHGAHHYAHIARLIEREGW